MTRWGCTAGLSLTAALSVGQWNWEQLPDFPGTARDDAASFTLNQGITYIGTGMEVGWGLTNDWWRSDGWQWQQVASLPASPRQYCAAVDVNDQGYLFGGIDGGGALNELWRYDQTSDTWTQMPSLPSEGRYAAVAMNLDGDLLIAYGLLGSGSPTREAWLFRTQTNTWQQLDNAPAPARHRAASDAISRTIYGGMDADGNVLDDVWSVDYFNGSIQWSALPAMPAPRFGAKAAFGVVVGGGSSWGEIHDNVWRFNGQNWSVLDPFPGGARRGGVVGTRCCLGGFIHFGLGLDGTMTRRQDWWTMQVFNNVDEQDQQLLQLWPNPVSNEFRLKWPHGAPVAPYSLHDATGRTVSSGIASNGGPIDASRLPSGLYALTLQLNDGDAHGKFIKLP